MSSLAIETRHLTRDFGDVRAVDASTCGSSAAPSTASSARTGPASRPPSRCSPACSPRPAGEIRVLGRDMLDPHAGARRQAAHRRHRREPVAVRQPDRARVPHVRRPDAPDAARDDPQPRRTNCSPCSAWPDEEKKLTLEYSHGMKKKLALAAALLPNPDLLFLDEPFEGVDAVTSRVIRDLLAGFVARGSTVFLTSHVLEIVERLCTHVGIIVKRAARRAGVAGAIRQGGSLENRFLQRPGRMPRPPRSSPGWRRPHREPRSTSGRSSGSAGGCGSTSSGEAGRSTPSS